MTRASPELKLRLRANGKGHWYIHAPGEKPKPTGIAAEAGAGPNTKPPEDALRALENHMSAAAARPKPGSSLLAVPLNRVIRWAHDRRFGDKPHYFKALAGFWGSRTVGAIDQQAIEAYLVERSSQPKRVGSGAVSRKTASIELEYLRMAIKAYSDEFRVEGTFVMTIKREKRRKRTPKRLTRAEVTRLLIAARGLRWDAKGKAWVPRPPLTRGRVTRGRDMLARLIILSIYTGSTTACLSRLRWRGESGCGHSYVDLDADQSLLYRLGPDAPSGKLAGMPIHLNFRMAAHMRRWRGLDEAAGIEHVLHGKASFFLDLLCVDAGVRRITLEDLSLAPAMDLVRRENVKMRSTAMLMGMSLSSFAARFGHKHPSYQKLAIAALQGKRPTVRHATSWKGKTAA